jgi:transposase
MPHRPADSRRVAVEFSRHPSQLTRDAHEITRKYLAKRDVCQRRSRSDHTPMIYHKALSAVVQLTLRAVGQSPT